MTAPTGPERRFDFRRAAIGVVTIIALLTIGALWQRAHPYSIETSTTIDASPDEVWAVLTDFDAYDEWNPTVTSVTGEPEKGSTLTVTSDGSSFESRVLAADAGRLLRWESHRGVVGVFDGERTFALEELSDGSTLFTQGELFRGVAVLFATDTLRDETAPSFHAMNAALRERVENR